MGDALTSSTVSFLPENAVSLPGWRPMLEAHYELLELLGRGGMSKIWLARDVDLRRKVVLKEFQRATRDEAAFRLFLREAQITAQLDHPCIPEVYGVGLLNHGTTAFMAMQWRPGRTLRAAIRDCHEQPWPQGYDIARIRPLLRMLAETCPVYSYAHGQGVVHCDAKPSNIVIGDSGQPMVLDWGLARVLPERPPDSRVDVFQQYDPYRAESVVAGTPAYMAPEQARGEVREIDARTDVFGLGATLFEVLTGRAPVADGGGAANVLMQKAEGKVPRAADFVPQVPASLDDICAKAMAPSKADRFATVADFAQALDEWLNGVV